MPALIEPVNPRGWPAPGGHYSWGMRAGDWLFISGQLGRRGGMDDEEAGDITRQTRRCLENIATILEDMGANYSALVRCGVYVSDVSQWGAVNAEYARILGDHRPARALIPTGTLHFGALVEIEAVALLAPR